MDVLDEKILTLLQEDAALSISEIAARIGLSQTPCWKRIQRLEAEGVILRRVALLDPEKVGLGLCAIVSIVAGEHSGRWLEEFTAYVSERPEVVEFYRMAGDVDFILRVVVADMAAYDKFYQSLIAVAPARSVVSRFAIERVKSTTALPLTGRVAPVHSRTREVAV
ncbi:DNA-binding transcriptional activator DecR [freshwater sediment metagenome]|jgi:Lrp/AsnC family transcriptional regulator|uniref:DNA-binding transcriptional activator DecR n=1 Tax=freshwater sediment metagenome TaxID=556182 RepID=A0AA48RC95_9ZZZZ